MNPFLRHINTWDPYPRILQIQTVGGQTHRHASFIKASIDTDADVLTPMLRHTVFTTDPHSSHTRSHICMLRGDLRCL